MRHQNRAVPGPASSATARRRQQLLRQHDIYPLARYRLVRRIGVCPLRRRLLNTAYPNLILGRCSLSFLKISGDFGTAASDCSRLLSGALSADNATTSPRESRRRVRVAQASRERERGDYDKGGLTAAGDLACTAAVAYAPSDRSGGRLSVPYCTAGCQPEDPPIRVGTTRRGFISAYASENFAMEFGKCDSALDRTVSCCEACPPVPSK